ncbi:MAG: GNAT family N-acetyltransferase [Rickettsiales bacterium]
MQENQDAYEKNIVLCDQGTLKAGSLEVFIANKRSDITAAQELRYKVYFEEMGAVASEEQKRTRRDVDEFDEVCDHLLVVDHQPEGHYKVVGTYRLLRREDMKRIGRFYSDGEYDISLIKNYPGEILEVGRSCVDADYRNRAVMQLLWRGIGAYVTKFNIEVLFGCASFHGTDPKEHATALSYLYHNHMAPEELCPTALSDRFVEMNYMPKEEINEKRAFVSLPTLIKGYIRLNGYIGMGAVIDKAYNTTDVSIVVKTNLINEKYAHRYGAEAKKSS